MNNKLPRAVIFDWDNTLVDTWPLIHFAINQTMGKMGRDLWDLDKVKNDVHKSMRESFPALFGEKWQEAGEIYKSNYRSQHLEKLELLPQAMDLIDFFYDEKIPIFVISNKIGNTLRMEIEALGISDKFFAQIGAGDAEFDKPHQAPVDLALQGSGVDPQKELVWFVGDSITDIECAINTSCQPILYGEGRNVPKILIKKEMEKKDKPMLWFKNHQEILGYLNQSSAVRYQL